MIMKWLTSSGISGNMIGSTEPLALKAQIITLTLFLKTAKMLLKIQRFLKQVHVDHRMVLYATLEAKSEKSKQTELI